MELFLTSMVDLFGALDGVHRSKHPAGKDDELARYSNFDAVLDGDYSSTTPVVPVVQETPATHTPAAKLEAVRLLDLRELDYIEKFLETLAPDAPTVLTRGDTTPARQRLDEKEKRVRHVASEHKRRDRIKDELARMTTLVHNTAVGKTRNSQAKILARANDYIEQLKWENNQLRAALAQPGSAPRL